MNVAVLSHLLRGPVADLNMFQMKRAAQESVLTQVTMLQSLYVHVLCVWVTKMATNKRTETKRGKPLHLLTRKYSNKSETLFILV